MYQYDKTKKRDCMIKKKAAVDAAFATEKSKLQE